MCISKPKLAYVRDRNEQENSTQYQMCYGNDYRRDKSNRRNNYRLNVECGEEQQRCKKNSRLGNSNNVTTSQQTNNNDLNNKSEETGDTLTEVLTLVNCQTSNMDTVIVPGTQDNDRTHFFLVNNASL